MTYLEMRACDGFGELVEQGFLHLCKLCRIHDLEDVFYFVQEHDFLGAVHLGPISQETEDHLTRLAHITFFWDEFFGTNLFGECSVLFKKLHDAVSELRVVHGQTLDLVKGNEDACEEKFVLLLEWQGEAVDNGAQNLKQLGNSVKALSFINELEKDIVDGTANVGSEVEEFAIDSVQSRLKEISLPRVFRIEQLE